MSSNEKSVTKCRYPLFTTQKNHTEEEQYEEVILVKDEKFRDG